MKRFIEREETKPFGYWLINLPGHFGDAHALACILRPTHSFPLPCGGGLVQYRSLMLTVLVLHVLVHADHDVQPVKPPLTKNKYNKKNLSSR